MSYEWDESTVVIENSGNNKRFANNWRSQPNRNEGFGFNRPNRDRGFQQSSQEGHIIKIPTKFVGRVIGILYMN